VEEYTAEWRPPYKISESRGGLDRDGCLPINLTRSAFREVGEISTAAMITDAAPGIRKVIKYAKD
jgi:hypothetical protein